MVAEANFDALSFLSHESILTCENVFALSAKSINQRVKNETQESGENAKAKEERRKSDADGLSHSIAITACPRADCDLPPAYLSSTELV